MQKPESQPEMGQQGQLWEKGNEQRAKVERRDSKMVGFLCFPSGLVVEKPPASVGDKIDP